MKDKKDICFFYEEYWFSWWVKTYIDQINKYLLNKWYKTTVISLIKGDNCISLVNRENINIKLTPFYLFKLLIYFLKNDFKIVHCQSLYSLILMNLVKIILFKKYTIISTIHIPYWKSFFTSVLRKLNISIKCDYLIWCCKYALSETIKKNIVEGKNMSYILNWSSHYKNDNTIQKDNEIIFVWHLTYQKNIDLLRDLATKLKNYNFKIIWDWEERYKLENIDNIKLIGLLKHDLVLREIRKSKLLLLTSRFEALPYAVLESLSLWIPVVSSNVGGISELTKYTNQLFLCENKEDFIRNVNKVYNTENEKFLNNISKISFNNQIIKYMKIYRQYL